MDLISIIIPVYNVENYIYRCVDSVLGQTYTNLEIILVDDGSPDSCGQICDEYAQKDNRIKVIHKENGGLSDARNHGIDAATGEWLFFLDSDDWIHPQSMEKLYEAAEKNKVSVSMCGYLQTEGDNPIVDVSIQAEMWLPRDIYLKHHVVSTVACAKLYSKDCFEKIRYPKGKLHEDEFVTYKILFQQDKIAFINQPYYAYFINNEGITKSKWNPQRLIILDAFEERLSFFKKIRDIELIEKTEQLYLWLLVNSHKNAGKAGFRKEAKELVVRVFFMTLKKPKLFFCENNIWVLEYFFPHFMCLYWFAKGIVSKLVKRF